MSVDVDVEEGGGETGDGGKYFDWDDLKILEDVNMTVYKVMCWVILAIGLYFSARKIYYGWKVYLIKKEKRRQLKKSPIPCPTMVIIGSGGHTAEMLNLLKSLDLNLYSPRTYVISHSDSRSKKKVLKFERERGDPRYDFSFEIVHRAREVGQNWFTTVCLTLPAAVIDSLLVLIRFRPYLILCNGPGICVPMALLATILREIRVMEGKTVYVESICRVNALSMSGKVLWHIADEFIVQWEELKEIYSGAETTYLGRVS